MSKRSEAAIQHYISIYGSEQQKNKQVVDKCVQQLREQDLQEHATECAHVLGLPVVIYSPPAHAVGRQPHGKSGQNYKRTSFRGIHEVTLTLPAGRSFD